MDFKSLKKGSTADKLAKLTEQLDKETGSTYVADEEGYWKPEVDKVGNGYAVIRFLDRPAVDGDDGIPWDRMFHHAFKGPGGWYIENSLTTKGQNDPVSEYNSKLWDTGIESNKNIARAQKRKLTYTSNILVIDDPKHPENNGKVFKYRYGKKIFEKITDKMKPQFPGEKAVIVYDFWDGCNFQLKIRDYEGYRNYDKSEWDASTPVYTDDAKIEALWKSLPSLKALSDAKNFKTYDELKARLDRVLGLGSRPSHDEPDFEEDVTKSEENVIKAATQKVSDIDDDDPDSFFKNLAS